MATRALARIACASLLAGTLAADVLPPGHKGVEHDIAVLEPLPDGLVVVAAPTRGFGGVEVLAPGAPIPFSSKYGTRLYVLPAGAAIPADPGAVRAAAIASADLPVSEVVSAPIVSPLSSVVTMLRLTVPTPGQLTVEVVDEVRSNAILAQGNLRLVLGTMLAVGAIGVAAILILVRRRVRASQPR
jgi:hypothetical protein